MFETLFYSNSSVHVVFEGSQAETHRRVVVEHLVEELSALLDLEVVSPVHRSLVDCAADVALLGLSFS